MAKECMICLNKVKPHEKLGGSSDCIYDHGNSIFAHVSYRPSTKAHTVILSKRHTEDLRTLTNQEWTDILPVLKESVQKINRVYKPLGYRISIPTGINGNQDQPLIFIWG